MRTALLVVGSPRGRKSVSHSFAAYLADRLQNRGMKVEIQYAVRFERSSPLKAHFHGSLDTADETVLIFPLYADQVPGLLVEAMEDYARHRAANPVPKVRGLTAVVNCGFPEARHTDTALAVARRFADTQGLRWRGGLGIGGAVPSLPGESWNRWGG